MKRLLIFTSIFTLLLSTLIFADKKQWKQPQLKEGQTIQEAFEELRQNRNQKIERRKQEAIASKSEAIKEKKYRGFDFSNKYDKKQEKKMRRARASESQIDRLEPRKFEINDLMDIKHENVLLGGNKDETRKNGKKK